MHPTVIGLFCGLLLGLAYTTGGFGGLVITAALAIIGYVVGKVVAGDVDLNQYLFVDIGWLSGTAAVAVASGSGAPRAFSAPNPFSSGTAIRFSLARSGKAEVAVFDARGSLVKRVASSWRPAGAQRVEWDGTDGSGGRTPAGVYYWRVASEDAVQSGRVVRIP